MLEENLKTIYDYLKENNIITVKEANKIGIKRHVLSNLHKSGKLERIKQGVYQKSDIVVDEYALIQQNNNVIFSHSTALYFHGLSDRVPDTITLTVLQGYNSSHIKKINDKLKFFYVKKENFNLGKIEITSPMGAKIQVYDKERCICDIIKNKKNMDIQIFSNAIKDFFKDEEIKIRKLIKYSQKIGVEKEIRGYLEVM